MTSAAFANAKVQTLEKMLASVLMRVISKSRQTTNHNSLRMIKNKYSLKAEQLKMSKIKKVGDATNATASVKHTTSVVMQYVGSYSL